MQIDLRGRGQSPFFREQLRSLVLERLQGGVWHTTGTDSWVQILDAGWIAPAPRLTAEEAQCQSESYVRSLGGVSLFDFRQPVPSDYKEKYPNGMWEAFIPVYSRWNRCVWIQVDLPVDDSKFLSGVELLARWKSDATYGNVIPLVEAAYLACIPRGLFKRVFEVRLDHPCLIDL